MLLLLCDHEYHYVDTHYVHNYEHEMFMVSIERINTHMHLYILLCPKSIWLINMCCRKVFMWKAFSKNVYSRMNVWMKDVNANLVNESLLKGFINCILNWTMLWMLWLHERRSYIMMALKKGHSHQITYELCTCYIRG